MVNLDQPEKYPFMFKIVIRPMIGRHLDSMYVMEQYLENECQDIDYTIVRPPRLLDDPMIGMWKLFINFVVIFKLRQKYIPPLFVVNRIRQNSYSCDD